MGPQQQFGKVDQTTSITDFFVGGIHPMHRLGVEISKGRIHVTSAQALILLGIDVPLCLARWPARLIEVQIPTDAFHQPELVVAIKDLETLGQPGFLPVLFQQAMRQTVERPNPHALGGKGQHGLYATAHFPCRLVGKCHSENAMGRDALCPYQPGDTVYQHPGLA